MRKFLLLITVLVVSVSGVALAAPAKPTPAKQVKGTTWLSGNHSEGSKLIVSGDFKDNFFGRGALVYVTTISSGTQPGTVVITSKHITLFAKRGSLTGTGKATVTLNLDGTQTVTGGTFSLDKGAGIYKGHSFRGTFGGSYADFVYTFDYKGIYR